MTDQKGRNEGKLISCSSKVMVIENGNNNGIVNMDNIKN